METDLTAAVDEDLPVDEEAWDVPAEILEADLAAVADLSDDAEIVVSAFAGIGGIDTGFERAGFQTGVQIEWDAAASRVLAARFPHAVRFGDVRTVDGDAVRHALGGRKCRVLVGGFPCQDLSVAGRRAGMAGERSGLYGELLRLAADLDPDWLVVENVPGLLSADADPTANDGEGIGPGSGFALFLGDLTGFYGAVPVNGWRSSGVCHGPLGTAAWRVLDARHAGVAQRRRRVFVVFCPRDRVAPAAVLLEPEGVRRHPAARVPSWARPPVAAVDPALLGGGGAPLTGGAGDAPSPNGVEQVSSLTSAMTGGPDAAHALAGWMVPADKPATIVKSGHIDWRESELSGPLATRDFKGRPGETAVAYGVAMRGRAEGNVPEMSEEEVSALRAASGGSSRDLVVTEPTPLLEIGGRTGPASTGDVRAGLGVGDPGDPMFTLQAGKQHGVFAPETAATLTAGTSSPGVSAPGRRQEDDVNLVATPIQDGREMEKAQNGLGVGAPGDAAYTLDTTGAQSVAIQRDAYEVDKERGLPNDEGIKVTATDVAPTITADGDPAERTDRGLRIVEPAAWGISSDAVDRSGEGDGSAAQRSGLGITPELSPTLRAAHAQAVATAEPYRKSRRAATSSDDETWVEADHANTLNCFDGGDTRATEVVVESTFMVEPESGQGADLLARPTDHAPSLTALNGQAHDRGVRVASNAPSGAAVRRLTPLECERLQGLPDGWTAPPGVATSDSARYRQLGNAVCANVAEWIACRIADYRDGLLVLA